MKTKELIEMARKKGYAIAKVNTGIYQYSKNGYEWTYVHGATWGQFCELIKSL